MKGLDELITIYHSGTHGHSPTPIEIRFNHLSSRSNISETISYIFTSLVACQVKRDDSSTALLHYTLYMNNGHVSWWLIAEEYWKLSRPLYYIVFLGSSLITWHDDSSRRNLFLEDYRISASLFGFRGSNTKLFFAIYLLYFRDMLWHDQNITNHLTSHSSPPNENTILTLALVPHMKISTLDLAWWQLKSFWQRL